MEEQHREPEGRTSAWPALDADAATHHLDQVPGDRQPQAGAAVAPGDAVVLLGEGRKDVIDAFGADADAGVRDLEAQQGLSVALVEHFDLEAHLASFGELDGVADQVHEHLADATGIAAQAGRQVLRMQDVQLEALLLGAVAHDVLDLAQEPGQVEVEVLERHPAGLDLGEVQDVVDDGQQGLAARLEHGGQALLAAVKLRVPQDLDDADHAVHGRADLVAHVGQKLALGHAGALGLLDQQVGAFDGLLELAVDGVGLLLGASECQLGLLALGDVAGHAQDFGQATLLMAQEAQGRLGQHQAAVLAAVFEFDLAGRGRAAELVAHQLTQTRGRGDAQEVL
ncbi:MAG: hypothetical protein BWY87_01697 [Deltaproteobacteria bacterium ADurb.Bin510]|nr:MAG: hypothetical protein BWY87_01697 [Deltaproteobacteria bacterium ADurb.Bin510]